jgi:predicted GH43/DUF377 family glycosyl hydrolase
MAPFFSKALMLVVAAGSRFTAADYDVKVVSRSEHPGLSYIDGTSSYQQIFNAAWVEGSAETGGRSGLICRTQNCDSDVGGSCVFCGGSQEKASILTFSEYFDGKFVSVNESSVVFGPSNEWDTWGTEDPRIAYNKADGLYYMFYTAYNGKDIQLSLATTKNPTSASGWTKHGAVFPDVQNTKSGALLLRDSGPHYLLWGDHDIRITSSENPLVWPEVGDVLISPRADHFDSQLVESGPPPLKLSTGDYLFFYNSAELGWPAEGTAYNVGWLVLSGSDPSTILSRSSVPLMSPFYEWEAGLSPYTCNVPNVVFLEAARPLGDDSFEVFFGAADATIGSAVVKVEYK